MENDLSFPPALRWRPPTPRPAPVTEEHHCAPGCVHLSEAYRRGKEVGAREERERQQEGFPAAWAFWAGVLLTSLVWIAVAGLGR